MIEAKTIEAGAQAAVARLLARVEAAADDLPEDVRIERQSDGIALIGPRVRLRALTDARIIGLFGAGR